MSGVGRADADDAPIVNLNDGQANGNRNHRDNCNDNLLFRPAVVLMNKKCGQKGLL